MTQILLPIPHVPQRQQGDCLVACAAMMLLYLNQPTNYDQLLKLLQIKVGIGAPVSNVRHLEKLGVRVPIGKATCRIYTITWATTNPA